MSDIIEGLNKAVGKAQELGGRLVDSAKEALDKTDLDEKIVGAAKDLRDKAKEALNKTDIDEKIVGAAKDLKDKAVELVSQPETPEAMSEIDDDVNARIQSIRNAASASNPIHDYMQSKHNEKP